MSFQHRLKTPKKNLEQIDWYKISQSATFYLVKLANDTQGVKTV